MINKGIVPSVSLNIGEDYRYQLQGNVWEVYNSCYDTPLPYPDLRLRIDNQNSAVADVWIDSLSVLRITGRSVGTSDIILFAYISGPNNDVADAIHFAVTIK